MPRRAIPESFRHAGRPYPFGSPAAPPVSQIPLAGRPLRSVLAVLIATGCAVALGGCFTLQSTITVRPDGSGTVVETLALSGPAVSMADDEEAPLSSEAALRARAAGLGEGVTLVSSDTSGAVRTTTYAFRDVAALRYRLPDNAGEAEHVASTAAAPPLYTFAFEPALGPDGAAVLRVVVPETDPADLAMPDSATVAQTMQGLSFARMLFGDARATVSLVADGETVETDAAVHDGRTTTLLDLAFGPLFDLVEQHPELATRQDPPLDEIRRLAGGREGLTVQAPGTVTIRFR